MSRLWNGIWTHKKKCLFFSGVAAFAANYLNNEHQLRTRMRSFCLEAAQHGRQSVRLFGEPDPIVVILRPGSRRGRGRDYFDKYAAPILNVAGKSVTLITGTDDEQVQMLARELDETPSTLILAGDDSDIVRALSGLVERTWDRKRQLPKRYPCATRIGIVPLGKTSKFRELLESGGGGLRVDANDVATAAIRIVRGHVDALDVVHVLSTTQLEGEAAQQDSLFALNQVRLGHFADAEALFQKYWYFGVLREKYALFRTALRRSFAPIEATLEEMSTCQRKSRGEMEADRVREDGRSWWKRQLVPLAKPTAEEFPVPESVPADDDEIGWRGEEVLSSDIVFSTGNLLPKSEQRLASSGYRLAVLQSALTKWQLTSVAFRLGWDSILQSLQNDYRVSNSQLVHLSFGGDELSSTVFPPDTEASADDSAPAPNKSPESPAEKPKSGKNLQHKETEEEKRRREAFESLPAVSIDGLRTHTSELRLNNLPKFLPVFTDS